MKNQFSIRILQGFFLLLLLSVLFITNADGKQSNTINRAGNVHRNEYQRISCGYNSSFELRGGTLWAWGSNFNGQLGDGTYNDHENPVQVGNDNTWHSIAGGTGHTLALKADGSLWAWGNNTYGQLGNGNNTSNPSPTQIAGTWTYIAANNSFSLGLKADGSLWAWGINDNGQLGDGTTTNRNSPVQIPGTWAAVAAGAFHTLALQADGSLWVWGGNSDGQLGDGTNTNHASPVQIPGTWTTVAAGAYHSAALKADGSLWTWGKNAYGQLGIGNNTSSNIPVQVTGTWTSIATGTDNSMALKANGELWTWGYNTYGSLGDGTNTHRNAPVQVAGSWVNISAGAGHTIGEKVDGTLWAWGRNDYGQFGNGNWTNSNVPVQTSVALHEWTKVNGGEYFTLALKSDGALWAWGYNGHGELGDGTTTDKYMPVLISGSWLDVSGGEYHSLGIKSDGTLWAWGYNNNGQLGDGTNTSSTIPVQVGTGNDWVAVSAALNHSMALKADGTLWAWGANYYGQMGDGSYVDKNTPTLIPGTWRTIVAGSYHSFGLRDNGTLWAWGQNFYHGQLGIGANTDYTYPVQAGTDNSWLRISSGYAHGMGLKANGTIWVWGYDGYGQLGDNSYTDKNSPIQVGAGNNWASIATGDIHCLALTDNGNLWGWGFNSYGTLGDGTSTDRLVPVQIIAETNVAQLYQSTNSYHSAILKPTRDKVCMAGYNAYGQLGNGNATNSTSYNCITNCVPVAPSITISANPNDTICSGTLVTFNTAVQNAGPAPSYQWYKNGNPAGANQDSYSSSLFNDSDVIYCVMTSSASCLTQPTATSNTDTIRWNVPNVALAGDAGNTETNRVFVTDSTTVSYTDCDLMATIIPSGASPLIDTLTVKVTIDNTANNFNGQPYLQRHYDLEPSSPNGTPTATIKLYAFQSEFDAYNVAAAAAGLPLLPTGAVDNGNVRITQFHGVGTAPGNYPGPEVLIIPTVTWNIWYGWWEMTFDVTGFSGFYIHTALGSGPLAIQLNDINAVNQGAKNRIDWSTTGETKGDIFTVERSIDGRNFTAIGDVASKGTASAYTYWDEKPYTGINYYRVKLTDAAKQASYTKVVSATVKGESNNIAAYPNPVRNTATVIVNGTQTGNGLLTITDITGRTLLSFAPKGNKTEIDLSTLSAGLYLLRYTDDARSEVIKIEKVN